jgi:hypothetical protein
MKAIDKQFLSKTLLNLILIAFLVGQIGCSNQGTESSGDDLSVSDHFDPKGKGPSEYTKKILDDARNSLPFSDTRDFEENKKGFIAAMTERQIMADPGHVAWDMDALRSLRVSIR